MSKRTLLEIGDRWRAVETALERADGELTTPEIDAEYQAITKFIAQDEPAELDNAVNYLRYLEMKAASLTAVADQWQAECDRRKTAARVAANRAERQKAFLLNYVESTGRTKAQTATGRILAVQQNGGKPPLRLVDNIDPATVPDHLVVVRRTLDHEAIRKGLLEADPDAKRIAMLDNVGRHLRIR